ncbi:MAG: segregation and condensation protein A [Patescibacteria group bacterium]
MSELKTSSTFKVQFSPQIRTFANGKNQHCRCRMTATTGTFTIQLPQFKGPFDLLLFFIERDELDIYDIPIATITVEFLEYIRAMEALNIDLASEFILVAASLMRIKAKMLIPREIIDEEGNEIDPRDELVQRLLEYKRYKSVLDEMRQLEEDRGLRVEKGYNMEEIKTIAEKALVDVELESLTLFKLMKAYKNVLERLEDKKKQQIHQVYVYNHTVAGQQVYILSKLKWGEKTDFTDIFMACEDRVHAIITFLSMLELLNMQKIKAVNGEGVNNFWLEMSDGQNDIPEEERVSIADSASEDSEE